MTSIIAWVSEPLHWYWFSWNE